MGQLEVVADGRRYLFEPGTEIICGRSTDAQVPMTDRRIGRVHARLAYEGDAWYLIDSRSTNGTWIDGARIERQRVDNEVTAYLGNPNDGGLLYVRPYPEPQDRTAALPGPGAGEPALGGAAGAPALGASGADPAGAGNAAAADGGYPTAAGTGYPTAVGTGYPATVPVGDQPVDPATGWGPPSPVPNPAEVPNLPEAPGTNPTVGLPTSEYHQVAGYSPTEGYHSTAGYGQAAGADAAGQLPPASFESGYGQVPSAPGYPAGGYPGTGYPPAPGFGPASMPPGGGLPGPGRPVSVEGTLATGQPSQPSPVLVLRLGTRTLIFPVGQPVRIGRDAGLEATTDHPLVTRNYHGLLTSDFAGATYTDSSSRGTYHNGRQLKAPLRITEPVTLRLGDPATGEELGITPPLSLDRLHANQRRRERGTRLKVLAGIVAIVLVLAGVGTAIVLTRHTGKQNQATTLTTATLHHAEAATVRLLQGSVANYIGWGSGTVISSDGLILTNAHVAAPSTPGAAVAEATPGSALDANPDFLTVEFTTGDANAAVPKYRAKTVAVDGYLDLAVVKIVSNLDGSPIKAGSLNLPFLKLGDVSKVGLDQTITILGFPGVSGSDSITVTSGVISTFIPDPLHHVKDDRYEMESTARVAHGNSGGAAINNAGELIGIPSLEIPGQGADLSWRLRSVASAAPLVAAARAGTAYQSHLLVTLNGHENVLASGIGPDLNTACTGATSLPTGQSQLTFAFRYTGASTGLDVAFLIKLPDGTVVTTNALQDQSVPGLPEVVLTDKAGCVGYQISPAAVDLQAFPDGTYQAQLLGGPNLDPLSPPAALTVGTP